MKLSLVVLTPGKQEGKALEVKLAQFVIGRDPQCHLRPASPMISKRHCALLQRDNSVFLRDFDSTNGTFVNDAPVKGEVELKDGDTLKVGPLLFTVKIDLSAPVNRPTPAPATKPAATPVPAAAAKAPKPAVVADRTPLPATKANSEDDDIAAMLLGLGDDDTLAASAAAAVPDGSTEMEILVPPGSLPESGKGEEKKEEPAGAAKKEEKKPAPAPNASSSTAAKSILDQMMKRPRAK